MVKSWFLRRPEWEWWEAHQMEEKVTVSPQYWVSSFGIFFQLNGMIWIWVWWYMEKIRPVMGKWWIRIKYDPWAHLNTSTLYQRKKFASLQSISPLIQIWLSLGASETSCATNTMYIKCPPLVFSIPTGSGRKKWFWVSILIEIFICRSQQLIPTQKSSIQVKLQSSLI